MKTTIQDVKLAYIQMGYTPVFDTCKDRKEKLLAIDKNGYKVFTSLRKIVEGNHPHVFHIANPYTIENIKLWLNKNEKPFCILDTVFVGSAKNKSRWKCSICSNEWLAQWNSILHGSGCPECGRKSSTANNKVSFEVIKERVNKINPDIILLDGEFNYNSKKLNCECLIDGNKWTASLDNLSQGKGCKKCGDARRIEKTSLNIQYVKEKLREINPNISIIDNAYINSRTKLNCKCNICGHEWRTIWSSLKRCNCPSCSLLNLEGGYNKTLAERNKTKWIEKPAIVYTVKFVESNEIFYKIGITTTNIKSRLCVLPYKNYTIISKINTNLYDAIFLEQQLHILNKEHSYIPTRYFCGYTECFLKIVS